MSNLSVNRPLAATIAGNMTNPTRMSSPDPKEVAFSNGALARTIDIDLGAAQMVGSIYLGGVSGSTTFAVTGGTAAYTTTALGDILVAPKRTAIAPRQYLLQFDPISLRYIRLSATLADGFQVGIAAACERFTATYGHEWGAGRYLEDTSNVARNRAGGFGIDKGAIVPGYDFTLGDLTDEERESLFDMLRKVGESSPVIVAEEPDVTNDLDARLHYGLFQRLEKYERRSVGITRWSLKVSDWQ